LLTPQTSSSKHSQLVAYASCDIILSAAHLSGCQSM